MTSRPATSKRPSTVTTAESVSKPPCRIHSLAIVSDKAQISGTYPVEVGENSILHPYARIRAEGGRVVIGRNCTVWEKAVVGVSPDGAQGDVIIEDNVNIETGAIVEARSVGSGSSIGVGVRIGQGAVLGQCCKVTPLNEVKTGEELPDFTVVYGNGQKRFDQTTASHAEVREAKQKGQDMHIELLKKLIPNAGAKWG